jgi:hypothetical protein
MTASHTVTRGTNPSIQRFPSYQYYSYGDISIEFSLGHYQRVGTFSLQPIANGKLSIIIDKLTWLYSNVCSSLEDFWDWIQKLEPVEEVCQEGI